MTLATITRPAEMPRLGELPQTITLEVTQLDLFFGIRESGNRCPIACAFKRSLGALGLDVLTVDVMSSSASIMLRGAARDRWIEYRHDGGRFVYAFDRGDRVQPCTVTLRRAS